MPVGRSPRWRPSGHRRHGRVTGPLPTRHGPGWSCVQPPKSRVLPDCARRSGVPASRPWGVNNAFGATSMHYRLRLLGGFELRDDSAAITLPPSTQRVIAYLGLHDHPVSRVSVAGNLWLDSPDRQALANLRSSIWRLRQAATDLVRANGEQLGL